MAAQKPTDNKPKTVAQVNRDLQTTAREYTPAHQQNLINLYITENSLYGRSPTIEQSAKFLQVPKETVLKALADPDLVEKLARRGITLDNNAALSAQQIACANVLLDFSDTRTQSAKLRHLGVNSITFQGWLAQPQFNQYYRQRAEKLLDDAGATTAINTVMSQTGKGNLQAAKLLLELTGRHKDSTQINVQYLLQRVIETVALHVKDPATLTKIAEDFELIMRESES